MADNSTQQAPLEDPPNVPKRNPSEGAKRVRRCRSTPSDPTDQKLACPTDQKSAEPGSALQSEELFKGIRLSFILVGILLVVYFVAGVITFYLVMDQISGKRTNRVLDALYFVVITMTSVGYGDLVPKSDTTKLLACAFVFIGMGLIALFISKVADYLVEKQKVLFFRALNMNMKGDEAKMLRAMETNRIKYKFYSVALLLAIVILGGTVFLWKVEKLSLVDSFFCVCATITALGYGGKSFSSKFGRVFAIFWIITSTAILAQFFLYLAELNTERRQKMLAKWVLKRRITTMDLEAADLDGDRQVDAGEFILYKLKELGKISQQEISSFLEQFDKLDVDQSGALSSPRKGSQQIQAKLMADDSIDQAFVEDPPNVLKEKPSEGAKRFRRCRSTPANPTDQKPSEHVSAERVSVFQAKELFKDIRPSFRLVGLLVFVYLLVGVIIFYHFMDQISGKRTNRVLDAMYFVIVTMTSVGYGDLVPKSDTTKLLACAFVFTGMAIIALFISKAADYLVEKQEVLFFKAMHMNMKGGEAKMLRAMETNRIKYKFYTVALLLVMIVVTGTLFLWKIEKLSLVDSFYCVCATMTTLGYVDKCFSSKLGRIFAIFWVIMSTILMAQFFLYLAELYTEQRQKRLAKWVLNRRITTMDLEAADLDGDHQVSAAEFVLYKLKELGKISQEEISSFLEEFDELDVDQSGTISAYDLTLAQTSQ